jgi:hypothetical protein
MGKRGKLRSLLRQQQKVLDEQKTLLAQHEELLDCIVMVLERYDVTCVELRRVLKERVLASGNGRTEE